MKSRLWLVALAVLLACAHGGPRELQEAHGGALAAASLDVYDGFETPTLSSAWNESRFVPGALVIQSGRVRAGRNAAKITLHQGDHFEPGSRGGLPSERAELMETASLEAIEGRSYAYSFSMFIPRDFPIVPTRLVIAQWKQECPRTTCEPDNPVIAVRYAGGELRVTRQVGAERVTLYRTKEDVRSQWLGFRFQIRFSRNRDGRVRAWLNDKALCNFKGATAYPENTRSGYPSPSRFYFKMGLYRDRMAEPMTIYVDEYRKKELPGISP
jgi:hypothetical protein